jgi:serine/threonine protein phosphatase 1
MSFKTKFSSLGHPNRIWVVSAIHGELTRLTSIHKAVYEKFQPGDRLVYTGNYLGGTAAKPVETLDELLHFRRTLLAIPGLQPDDIVYLRGMQEELWGKLLQLQFAPNAGQVIDWMAAHHPDIDSIVRAYGSSLGEAARITREGILNLTRWSTALKNRIRAEPGHEKFFTVLRLAAFTENRHSNDNNLLFVHAGIDPARPLAAQGDQFWWAFKGFNGIKERYLPFRAVIRGHDPEQQGIHISSAVISLDGGSGRGGQLICARMSDAGEVLEILAA